MTSNLGSHLIQEHQSKPYNEIKTMVMDLVAQHFRPEFINRIDDSVVFHALTQSEIAHIATIQIQHLQHRLAAQNISLKLSAEALQYLADLGFDSVYGARPLKRVILQKLENPLAQSLLNGQFKPGDQVTVALKNNELTFIKELGTR